MNKPSLPNYTQSCNIYKSTYGIHMLIKTQKQH